MKFNQYQSNIYSYDRYINEVKGDGVTVIALNKKEALKFAKYFKGLEIYKRLTKIDLNYTPEEIMNMQKVLLAEKLDKKEMILKLH